MEDGFMSDKDGIMSDKFVDDLGEDSFIGLGGGSGRFLYVSYEDDLDEIILSSHSFVRKEFFDRERRRKEGLYRGLGLGN